MNKVITINLAGRSYSVEEPGYNTLKEYLDGAAQKLEQNPDKEEILKDFNMAIAEKCDAYLSSAKNVILTSEIEKILKEMGPVDAAANVGADAGASSGANDEAGSSPDNKKSSSDNSRGGSTGSSNANGASKPHKKLYLLPDTGVIFGVCSGLAAYFDIDVTLVRVIFVALTVITHGAWIFVYFVMGMVVPKANTPEERAEAWGAMRTTAQDLMHRARNGYEHFKGSDELRKWKKQLQEERRHWHQRGRWHMSQMNQGKSAFYELAQNVMGMLWFALVVYVAWFGYEHVEAVRNLFNTIGDAANKGVMDLTEWIKIKAGV